MIREFFVIIKKNTFINLLILVLTFFTLYLLFVLNYFGNSFEMNIQHEPPLFEGYELFQTIPNREGSFEGGGGDQEWLEKLQFLYYEILSSNDEFRYFSFGQGQPLRLGEHFLEVDNLSLTGFRLFGDYFELQDGRNFTEEDFSEFQGYFPIILGSDFREFNSVGDTFTAIYYDVPIELKIIGILRENQLFNSEIFDGSHRLITNYFQNHHVILPFISYRNVEIQSEEELSLWTELYTALTHGFLVFEDNDEAIDRALNTIHAGTAERGIDYHITGAFNWFLDNIELINLVRHQQETMRVLFISVGVVISAILLILKSIIYRFHEKAYYTLMLSGVPKWKVLLPVVLETVFLYAFIFAITYEFLVFDSGFIRNRSILTSPFAQANPWFNRWFMYREAWGQIPALGYVALFTILLCIICMSYPIIRIQRLYRKGR